MNWFLQFGHALLLISLTSSYMVPKMDNPGLFEGDMVLSPEQLQAMKNGGVSYGAKKDGRWPKTTIKYELTADLKGTTAEEEIERAIKEYQKYTCLRFEPFTGSGDVIRFYKGTGCSSDVGHKGGYQWISLGPSCWNKHTVIHEMGHALGFYHEHNRPDRDYFLIIHKENIHKLKLKQFDEAKDVNDKHFPFDYRSVMHYAKDSMARQGTVSIETKDPYYQDLIGNGAGLSEIDIMQINDMYDCPKYTGPLPVKQTPKCHDSRPFCETYARQGSCNLDWMKRLCQFSCKLCEIGAGVTYPPLPTVVAMTSAQQTTSKPSNICADKDSGICRYQKGQCRRSSKVRKNCRKTCGLCK